MLGFGASSIDVEIRAYVLTTDYSEFLTVQQELLLDIVRIVRKAGTGFAFPSQTAYLARDTGLDEAARERTEARVRARTQRPEAEAAVERETEPMFRQGRARHVR